MKILACLAAAACAAAASAASAQAPKLFRDADLQLGEKLIREHRCVDCHTRKVGSDGSAIYRLAGKINTPGRCAAWSTTAAPS